MKSRWALGNDVEWTAECPKPACHPESWSAEGGCETTNDPCSDTIKAWLAAGDDWGEKGADAPPGTWTAECPQPTCEYYETDPVTNKCPDANSDTDEGPLEGAITKACGGLVDPDDACDLGKDETMDDGQNVRLFSQCDCDRLGGEWYENKKVAGLGECYGEGGESYTWTCSKTRREEEAKNAMDHLKAVKGEQTARDKAYQDMLDEIANDPLQSKTGRDKKYAHDEEVIVPSQKPLHQDFFYYASVLAEDWASYGDEMKLTIMKEQNIPTSKLAELDGLAQDALQKEGWEDPDRATPSEWATGPDETQKAAFSALVDQQRQSFAAPFTPFPPVAVPIVPPSEPLPEAKPKETPLHDAFVQTYDMTPEDFMSRDNQEDIAQHNGRPVQEVRDEAEAARGGGRRRKNVGRGTQMSKQMTLSESQRPGKHHIQALQRHRIARQTVKIVPAHHRPVLLREMSPAATIGISGMGRTGGDIPRPNSSQQDWYYPTDLNFEAGAESSGNAGGAYMASF